MKLKQKNITKYLYLKNSLEKGMTFEEIKEQYLNTFENLTKIKKEDLEIKARSLYKFWRIYFVNNTADIPMDSKPNIENTGDIENQIFLLNGESEKWLTGKKILRKQ